MDQDEDHLEGFMTLRVVLSSIEGTGYRLMAATANLGVHITNHDCGDEMQSDLSDKDRSQGCFSKFYTYEPRRVISRGYVLLYPTIQCP